MTLLVLLAWLLQSLVVSAGAFACARLALHRIPDLELWLWRAVLATMLALPLLPQPVTADHMRGDPYAADNTGGATGFPSPSSARHGGDSIRWLPYVLAGGGALRILWLLTGHVRIRRRLLSLQPRVSPDFSEMSRKLGVSARLCYDDRATTPFNFGVAPSFVVVPAAIEWADIQTRRSIFAHELIHVRRGDWRWNLAEELIASALWFNPCARVAVNLAQAARERAVDRVAAHEVGSRKAYLNTLMSLATHPVTPRLTLPMFRSSQLASRVVALLAKEPFMSRRHLILAGIATFVITAGVVAGASRAFPIPGGVPPLQAPEGGDETTDALRHLPPTEPGPLERTAFVAPRDAPPPRKLHHVSPSVDTSVMGIVGRAAFTVRIVLQSDGTVAEARVLSFRLRETAQTSRLADAARSLAQSALTAMRQWRFAAPDRSPLAVTLAIAFDEPSGNQVSTTEQPIVITLENAAYPDEARQRRIEGTVVVEAHVDASGKVTAARAVKSVPTLDQAAIDAVRAAQFEPGRRDGIPVPVTVQIAVAFRLR